MGKGPAPIKFGIEVSGLKEMSKDIKNADPVLRKSLKLALKRGADEVALRYQTNIGAYSSRIGPTIKTGSTLTAAYVKAGGPNAPHAAPFENMGKDGKFRHPVFGNRDVWVDQEAHPAAIRALASEAQRVTVLITEAIDEWARAAGFTS